MNLLKVGDLVYDPQISKSKYGYLVDRTSGIIIGEEEDRTNEPTTYCDCYKLKWLVMWTNAEIIMLQCECELELINNV